MAELVDRIRALEDELNRVKTALFEELEKNKKSEEKARKHFDERMRKDRCRYVNKFDRISTVIQYHDEQLASLNKMVVSHDYKIKESKFL